MLGKGPYLLTPAHHERGDDAKGGQMARQEVLDQIQQMLGAVPGWFAGMPDPQLEHQWGLTVWFLSDTKLSGRDKALVAFGAAATAHCVY